ncbi:hypothetical protein OIK40_09035 [Erythrobacter sp. sf7]|uniref:Uncharacterized protein n=1 Tax=Erythrobacter fulvus TaxID=2987523 RepID=A0ABT5JRM1_9SPHN|nr:hypothetical protein [Erythrobacter fulvus]MDC8754783.1 hypothetical protein [Erythrobacter fulvus]
MLTSLLAPIAAVAALALQAAPAVPAPTPEPMTQEQRALLRCSAAFALVANGQANSDPEATRWPDLGTRGREFFVRTMAQLMDQTGLDRAGISRIAEEHARTLSARGEVGKIMPSCLLMLEASGV